MSAPTDAGRPASGLRLILPAMVVASGLGYGVQVLIPILVDEVTYVDVTAFWSALFLCVAAATGVQQEVTRATSRSVAPAGGTRTLGVFAAVVAPALAVLAAVVGAAVAAVVAPERAVVFPLALAVGLAGYALVAILVGTAFGTQAWAGAALGMSADPAVRIIAVGLLWVAVALGAGTLGFDALAFAVVIPFWIAAAILWLRLRRDPGSHVAVDAPVPTLLGHSAQTIVSSTALGFVSVGLPLVVTLIGAGVPRAQLAGVLLVVTLARAPLVSPALALQSYLTVRFRAAASPLRAVLIPAAAVLVVGVVGAVAGAFLVGPLMGLLPGDYVVPSPWFVVAVIASAALVAVACVTGAALLSRSRHAWYTAGWVVTALVAIGVAMIPLGLEQRVIWMLVCGPLVGCVVHLVGVARTPVGQVSA